MGSEELKGTETEIKLVKEIKKMRNRFFVLMLFQLITLCIMIGTLAWGSIQYKKFQKYEDEVEEVFENVRQLDGFVDEIRTKYDENREKIEKIFNTVDKIEKAIETLQEKLSGLSGISSFFGIEKN